MAERVRPSAIRGGLAVWASRSDMAPELVRALEGLGYSAVWVGGADGDLRVVEGLLAETTSIVVGTGVVNMHISPAEETAAAFLRLDARFPGRIMLGVGVGHSEYHGAAYRKPYLTAHAYLQTLAAAGVPKSSVLLAALGPRMLGLAGEQAGGAHPYLVTPAHTKAARIVLGPGRLLVPEQKFVIASDTERARELSRKLLASPYLEMRNYRTNLLRCGFAERDLEHGGSDRLIDALVACGTPEQIAARGAEHLEAGADQVAFQLVPDPDGRPEDRVAQYAALTRAWAQVSTASAPCRPAAGAVTSAASI